MPVIAAVIALLFGVFTQCGSNSTETRYVALSDDLTICNLICDVDGEYLLDHVFVSIVLIYDCTGLRSPEIYGKYKERTVVDKTHGCVIIKNLQYSDAGDYALWFTDKEWNKRCVELVRCNLIAPVTITDITYSSGDLVENATLSVLYTGDPPVFVFWTKEGEDLPLGHWLSDHNKTLSMPKHATGLYRVTVSNIVSTDNMTYTIPARGRHEHFQWWIIPAVVLPVAALVSILLYMKKKEPCKQRDTVI
ncbi:uncharacterized protein LOC134981201 [Pseudophryne corroboree]|uniref:uncharacterized protein LOC134981201 n=1 Tax=Pseudophryne corroboree TaxID=495146 RepID=UPI003081C639